jgi:hypothetical protein
MGYMANYLVNREAEPQLPKTSVLLLLLLDLNCDYRTGERAAFQAYLRTRITFGGSYKGSLPLHTISTIG